MSLKESQKSLRAWTKQKWRTKSGKPSSETGERYLPEKAIKALSDKNIDLLRKLNEKELKQVSSLLNNPKRLPEKLESIER